MKLETKIKRAIKNLVNKHFWSEEKAKLAVCETMNYFNLEKVSVVYFTDAVINTYNVDGVER